MANRATQEIIVRHPEKREDKVVIIDGDTLKFLAFYTGKDEYGNKKPEYTEEEYEIAEGILTECLLKIYNSIEEYYNVKNTFLCVKGENNFRYDILPEYKSSRPPSPPIIKHLHQYMIDCHNALEAPSGEADDMVYSLSCKFPDCIIVSCDKDLLQIEGIHWNYQKLEWKRVNKEEARHHLVLKILTGDAGDHVLINKGLGVKKAEKYVQKGMTNYQYIKGIYKAYSKYNNKEDVKPLIRRTYHLLRLHEI